MLFQTVDILSYASERNSDILRADRTFVVFLTDSADNLQTEAFVRNIQRFSYQQIHALMYLIQSDVSQIPETNYAVILNIAYNRSLLK